MCFGWIFGVIAAFILALFAWIAPFSDDEMAETPVIITEIPATLVATALPTEIGSTEPATVPPSATEVFQPLGSPAAGTSESGEAVVLYFYFDPSDFGGTYIYGEFQNMSDQYIDSPELDFTFFDASGQIVDTASTSPILSIIDPGQTMPFTGSTDIDLDSWADYQYSMSGGEVADEFDLGYHAQGLETQNVNEVEAAGESLRVLGEVVNNGTVPASAVYVYALIYNSSGQFAGYQSGYVDKDQIDPGTSAPFEIDGYVDAGEGWTYRLIASGWPVS